jgi:hypothetical protein
MCIACRRRPAGMVRVQAQVHVQVQALACISGE